MRKLELDVIVKYLTDKEKLSAMIEGSAVA